MTNMVHIPIDGREFTLWAENMGHRDRESAAHALVTGVFGRANLQPFRIFESGRAWSLYASTGSDQSAIEQCIALAPPNWASVFKPEIRIRAMPDIAAGSRVGFDVRVRPIRRHDGGQERDAYAMDREKGHERSREESYAIWLAERFGEAADLECCRLTYCAVITTRRKRVTCGGTDAVLQGTVRVKDAPGFAKIMSGGIGRHKAYGMGMLLLRPADPFPQVG